MPLYFACVCMYLCFYTCMYERLHLCMSVCLQLDAHMLTYLYFYVFFYAIRSQCTCKSDCTSICVSIKLSTSALVFASPVTCIFASSGLVPLYFPLLPASVSFFPFPASHYPAFSIYHLAYV